MKGFLFTLLLLPLLIHAQAFENLDGYSDREHVIRDSVIFDPIETPPQFPGGEDSLYAFIAKEIQFPTHDTCQSETIWIGFLVEVNGEITNIEVLRGKCKLFIDEAIRLIKIMPRWVPGKYYDKLFRTKMRFPIKFM